MPTAFIQQRTDRVTGPNLQAAEGFSALGYTCEFFDNEQLARGALPLTRETPVVAGVSAFFMALKQLGVPRPTFVSLPEQLMSFAGRSVRMMTLREARRLEGPLFCKPYHGTKSFTGMVVSADGSWSTTAKVDPATLVVVADVVRFVAEFRCFVTRGVVVDVRPYALDGDPLCFPDAAIIRSVVSANADAPQGYAVDMGVLGTGETRLVELNDGHSLGDYGMFPARYARLLEARWCELMGTRPIP